MSVQTLERPGGQLAAAPGLAAVAAAHYAQTTGVRDATVAAVLALWLSMDSDDLDASWAAIAARIFVLLFAAQQSVAELAEAWVDDALEQQGLKGRPDASLVTEVMAGWASDGRPLETLLYSPVTAVKQSLARGEAPEVAMARGAAALERIVSTQVMDTARVADQLAIVRLDPDRTVAIRDFSPAPGTLAEFRKRGFRRGTFGYIRVLNPPSCGRCAVLAGVWYPWSAGFQRHPNCDCLNMPLYLASADELKLDPRAYFDSLSFEDQAKYFGTANAKAIIDGSDIYRVVNATGRRGNVYTAGGVDYTLEGASKRGFYGKGGNKPPRMTPEAIYAEAGDDRILALSMLERYGYLRT